MIRSTLCVASLLGALVSCGEMTPSNMSLVMFKSGKVKEPTVFKVKLAITAWETWRDPAPMYEIRDQYWAIRVRPYLRRDDMGASELICYVNKGSPAGKVVEEQLKDGGIHAALIRLRYSRRESFGDCCIVEEIEMLANESPSELTAKFSATRIGVVKNPEFDYLKGRIAVSLRTKLKYFKKPILRVVVLTEENGSRVVRDSIIDEPNVKMISRSDSIERSTTTAGNDNNEPPFWQRYIEEISATQSEVSGDKYKSVTYEGVPLATEWRHSVKGMREVHIFGYSKFDKDERATMVGYRIEMWYNGACINAYDTLNASKINQLQLPQDWHVAFKYPDKFKYRSPFSTKNVVRH